MKLSLMLLLVVGLWGAAKPQRWPFSSYTVRVFTGTPAVPKIDTPITLEHDADIREAAKGGPNFAGRYTVVGWGCGTSCEVFVIVDEVTGIVYEPPEISRGVELGVGDPAFRKDSRLLVIASCPPTEIYGLKDCKRKFLIWNAPRFVLIKSEAVTKASP